MYIPKTNHGDDKMEELYNGISKILHQEGRGLILALMMADFNIIVGEESTDKVVGFFGLGKTNERGKVITNFSKQSDLVLINAWFTKRKMKLYT